MNRRISVYGLLALVAALLFASCDQDVAFAESQSVSKDGWMADDTLTFSPSIESAGGTYDVYVWVRHTKEYDYSNIWLKVMSEPLLTKDSTYMLDIPVADKTGMWLGHCSQSLCTVRIKLKENYRFKEAAAFKVDVLQYMREENLKEVRDIGLEILPYADQE